MQDQHLFSTSVGQCQEKGRVFGLGVTKKPTSPWMPFPMLLTAISSKIPHKGMNLVEHHYDEFKVCFVPKSTFLLLKDFSYCISYILISLIFLSEEIN